MGNIYINIPEKVLILIEKSVLGRAIRVYRKSGVFTTRAIGVLEGSIKKLSCIYPNRRNVPIFFKEK